MELDQYYFNIYSELFRQSRMQGREEKKIDQATAHVHIGLHWLIRQRDVTLITVTPLAYTKPLKTIVTNQVNNEM